MESKTCIGFAFAAILFLNLCLETHALKCFVCGPEENCDRHFDDQTVNCGFTPVPSQFRYACVKYHIGQSVVRGCFLENFCESQPYCYACATDYCNGAEAKLISKLALSITTIALLSYKAIY